MSITKLNYSEKLQESLNEMERYFSDPGLPNPEVEVSVERNGYEVIKKYNDTECDKMSYTDSYNGITGVTTQTYNAEKTNGTLSYGEGSNSISIDFRSDGSIYNINACIGDSIVDIQNNPGDGSYVTTFTGMDGNVHEYNGLQYQGSRMDCNCEAEGIYIDLEKGETIYGPLNNDHEVLFDKLQRPITIIDNTDNDNPKVIETFEYED